MVLSLRVTGLLVSLAASLPILLLAQEPDILVADFEQETYGDWTVEGEAFGSGPAAGTLPGQMPVTGYRGQRLVNSFYGGDRSTGSLTSPLFVIERNYIVFLIGGGGFEDRTCMQLWVEGRPVRSATGPNTRPGGSEALEPYYWDVREFRGQRAQLKIIDQATGGWGHINVDHIVQTDVKPEFPIRSRRSKEWTVSDSYLLLPIDNEAPTTRVTLSIGGSPVYRYDVSLASAPEAVDWYAFLNLEPFHAKNCVIEAERATEEGFALVRQSSRIPGEENLYDLSLRPQFHFSQKVGWNNDPNGMVYWDGEWHLFFQHNPVGVRWGNMTWGHAVSPDLIHWEQLPDALFPETMARGACFSGSAVVDHKNTTGWGRNGRPALVAILTDTGSGESLAYSLDNGRRFTWYENNPVVQHRGRDPKVIWYRYRDGDTALNSQAERLGGHWVMAVYDEHPEYGRNIAFYTSTDLKDWIEQSHLPGYFECPELFELPVAGEPSQRRWVVYAADAQYAIGRFDGRKFVPEHSGKQRLHYGQYYASQLFNDAPGERRIQIGWAKIEMPGMPFNQTFSFPHELSLERTENGLRLLANPIEEIRILRTQAWTRENCRLNPGEPVALEVTGELFDIRAEWKVGDAGGVVLDLGGDRIRYDVRSAKLDEAPLPAEGGRVVIRVLVDRPMLEINGNDGAVVITRARHGRGPIQQIRVLAEGATAHLIRLEVCGLRSIWKK